MVSVFSPLCQRKKLTFANARGKSIKRIEIGKAMIQWKKEKSIFMGIFNENDISMKTLYGYTLKYFLWCGIQVCEFVRRGCFLSSITKKYLLLIENNIWFGIYCCRIHFLYFPQNLPWIWWNKISFSKLRGGETIFTLQYYFFLHPLPFYFDFIK